MECQICKRESERCQPIDIGSSTPIRRSYSSIRTGGYKDSLAVFAESPCTVWPFFDFSEDRCYPRDIMMEYVLLCQKYQIHFLSDESDALTTYSTDDIPNPTRFTSLLSIDKTGIIDPSLCHVIHGIGKVHIQTTLLILELLLI